MRDSLDDDQLRELLQSRDPAASLPPADPGQVARLLEDAMSHDLDTPAHGPIHDPATPEADPRRRTPLTWLLAAAAVLVIAGVGAFGFFGGEPDQQRVPDSVDQQATVLRLSAPAPTQGRCMMVTADALDRQQTAFDGTVTSIDGREVTLDVGHWYRGGDADMVVVEAADAELRALIQAVAFEQGGRYLVTANDGVVTVCGFSAAYSDDLAALYSEAFGT